MLRLVRPSVELRETFLDGMRAIARAAERYQWVYLGDAADLSFPERDFPGYVATLRRSERVAPPHFVRGVTYWGIVGGRMVGRLGLRLELNDFLARDGGHIGYCVRPDHRRRGHATGMLRLALATPEARAIGRLLLTCDEDNTASERTILKCGGVLESVAEAGPEKPRKKRFWIDLGSDGRDGGGV
jgi:predicted acetyltransferase